MSSGLAITRLMSRLMMRASSGSQSRTYGSAVAITASLVFTADRQDAEARRVRRGHHLGDRGEIDLERIDVQVFHADALRQPLGERIERQRARLPFFHFWSATMTSGCIVPR